MNKICSIFITFGLIPLCNVDASADLVAFPTGNAAWTVTVTPHGASDPSTPGANARPAAAQVVRAEIVQVNNVKRTELTWSDGKSTEKWSIPKLPVSFEEDPRNNFVTPLELVGTRAQLDHFWETYDHFAFEWLYPQALQEKQPISYMDKQCFHYVGKASIPFSGSVVKREAWIDAKTLLPVAYDNGISLSVYEFAKDPPTEPLVMPANFQQALNYYKNALGYP
jgi:hypothetical protein